MTRYCFLIASLLLTLPAALTAQKISSDTLNLAEILKIHDDYYYKEALPLWQKNLPKYELRKDTLGWITCLWGIADAKSRLGEKPQSDSIHKKAIALLERIPRQANNDLWPRVYSDYAKNSLHLPDTAACFAAIQRAIQEAAPFWGQPQFFYGAYNYNNLGFYYAKFRPDNIELVLKAFEKAIEAYEASGVGMERMYVTRLNLAIRYSNLNDDVRALREYSLIANWFENLPPKDRLGDTERLYSDIGSYYAMLGQTSKARDYYEKAEKWLTQLYGPFHSELVYLYSSLADLYISSERHAEALPWLDKGLKTANVVWGTTNDMHLDLRIRRVLAYVNLKNFPAAAADIEKMKVEVEQPMINKGLFMPYVHQTQAFYHKQKGELAKSLEQYRQTLALMKGETSETDDSYEMRPVLMDASVVLHDMNQPTEALSYGERALRLFWVKNPPAATEISLINVPDSLLIWDDFALSHTVNLWLSLLLQTKDPQKIEKAWANSLRVIQINEKFRRLRIGLDEQDFALWIDQLRNTYEIAIEIAQARYQQTKAPQYIAAQFQLCERFNTTKITESAVNVQAQSAAGIPDSLLAELQQLQDHMTRRENELAMLPQGPPAFDSLLHIWKIRRQTIVGNVESRYPRYHQMKNEIPETNIADIQQALPDDGVFISYFIHKDKKRLDIFTIDKKEGLKVTPAIIDSSLRDVVLDFHNMAQSVLLNRQTTRERFLKHAHTLYRQLLAPIAAQIADKKQLLIVPDDFLYYVPFEALVKDPTQTTFQQADFLIKKATISYQYSGRLYVGAALKNNMLKDAERKLFAFAPVFEGRTGDKDVESLHVIPNKDVTLRALNKRGEFVPLPYSEYEVKTIAQLFPSNQITLSIRGDAQEPTLKQAFQSSYRIVHIASHSFTNLRYPKFSGIACAPEKDTIKEGILYANEIYNLNAQADLVVLSSCESGIGKLNEDEGMLGLNRAFAYAGVPNVVYSLWKVNDKATSTLMVEFYKEMLAGKTYAAALRAAKLKMLENPATALPNFWSGFLLMGK